MTFFIFLVSPTFFCQFCAHLTFRVIPFIPCLSFSSLCLPSSFPSAVPSTIFLHPYIRLSHSPGFASLPTASCITSVLSNTPLLFSPPAHPVLCISGAHACTPPAAVGPWALKCNWEPLFFLEKCPR